MSNSFIRETIGKAIRQTVTKSSKHPYDINDDVELYDGY